MGPEPINWSVRHNVESGFRDPHIPNRNLKKSCLENKGAENSLFRESIRSILQDDLDMKGLGAQLV